MKTIEEQAVDYIKNVFPQRHILYKLEWVDIAMFMKRAFLAGARAATRWIPVEEELPEKKTRCLILPLNRDYPMPARHLSDGWFLIIELGLVIRKVSHWIPIPPDPEK